MVLVIFIVSITYLYMFTYKYVIVTYHPYRYWKVNPKLMGSFTKHYFPTCIPQRSFIQSILLPGCLLYCHAYCKDRHLSLSGPASPERVTQHRLKRKETVAACDTHAGNPYRRRPSACMYQIHLQALGYTVARMFSEI